MEVDEVLKMCEEFLPDDIEGMSPKDRANFWAALKEFELPKYQRTPYRNTNDDNEREFTINLKAHED